MAEKEKGARWDQAFYRPKNPRKYKGDPTQIVYRSSWEKRVMLWLDMHPACIEWSSETTVIPYRSPVDEKMHRYFVDFTVTMRQKNGEAKTFLLEVKPASQTVRPTKGKKREKTFLNEALTYEVNNAKWEAARKYASERGMEFLIVTEYDIGIAQRR